MQLKDNQFLGPISAVPADAKGNPVPDQKFDADPLFTIDDASLGSLVDTPSGKFFQPSGKLGVAHVQFSAKLNGVDLVGQSEDIVIVVSDAVSVAVSLGSPVAALPQ